MGACGDSVQANVDDLKSGNLWRALVAEIVGTAFLVFAGCSSCIDNKWLVSDSGNNTIVATDNPSTILSISLTFGLAVATVVWGIAHVSGGHINPAVTVGMLVARKITFVRAVLYVGAQIIGSIVGAAILSGLNPATLDDIKGKPQVCPTTLQDPMTPGKGLIVELLITFLLVFTVFSSCDKKRKDISGSAPLTIGLSVGLCHIFAIKYTGSSMNPARTFGPAVIGDIWTDHWIYWLGPLCGGILAGLLYEFIFAADSSMDKVKAMLSASGVEDDDDDDDDSANNEKNYRVKMTTVTEHNNNDREYRV